MQRNFVKILKEWDLDKKNKRPLVVLGARQSGKTYIIDEYCKNNYKNYFVINLFKDKELIKIYEENDNFNDRFQLLCTTYNIDFNDPETILFVDEVQECEMFIQDIKLLCESGIKNIIMAGSLLGVKLKRMKASYPVGKTHREMLYPMSFDEYLIAIGKERYISFIKKSFIENKECQLHEQLLKLYQRFLYLGGMPAVIQNYVDNNLDISQINHSILEDIYNEYMDDISKHVNDSKEVLRINNIYQNIPSQLMKENPKFMYAKFDKKERKSDYITALDWLISSNLVIQCNQITNPEYPIKGFIDDSNYKLYLNDTGILRNMVKANAFQVFMDEDYKYKGVFIENYLATELYKQFGEIYYWSRKGGHEGSNSEVDFLIQIGANVIPIEVKSGNDVRSQSLEYYNEKFNPKLMIKISTKNFGKVGNLKSIPLYATFLIKDLLEAELKEK